MGDGPRMIPLAESIKNKLDVATVGTAGTTYLLSIPWPSIAALVATLYTGLRIIELLVHWYQKWKQK